METPSLPEDELPEIEVDVDGMVDMMTQEAKPDIDISIDMSAMDEANKDRPVFTDYESYLDGFETRPSYDDYEITIDQAYAEKAVHHKFIQIDENWIASIQLEAGILVELD
jgi:hypothetical protein